MTKTSISVVALTLLFGGIMARLRTTIEKQVPLGYQDEHGFHFGGQPAEKKITWPPLW
jgi:hypothetical protein